MKGLKRMLLWSLCAVFALGVFACGNRGIDGGFGDDGSYKPSEQGTILNFWGWGDDIEGKVFSTLTEEFNKSVGKANKIEVKYNKIPSKEYETQAKLALSSNTTPDIVYVGDAAIKAWAEQGWLEQLDAPDNNYLEKSGGIDLDAMWPNAVNRYRYDTKATTSNTTDPLWGLPKDIGPTVIYYNKTFMQQAGITIVSVDESELATKFGTTIPTTTKTYSYKGYDAAQKVFNNRVAMSWEETVALAKLLMSANNIPYGFFTEWWFNYGWSVGGDCMQYVTDADGKPYYKFTLGDTQPNYIVKDDVETLEVTGGGTYRGGELISYVDRDRLTAEQKSAQCNQLPSQREAFTEFCRLSAGTTITVDTVNGQDLKGYGIAMNPSTLTGVDYSSYFSSGLCGMYIDGRWAVTKHRKMTTKYDWDVAPLPVYRSYNADGTVKAHGVAAGHSGSMAVSIASGSKNKNAAWMFLKYVAGEDGQSAQSKAGFAIPNQMALANDEDIFLQSNQKPSNSKIFLDAARVERAGDWTYLKDGEWIKIWSDKLNSDVRDGKMNLTTFFGTFTQPTQDKLYTYNNYKK